MKKTLLLIVVSMIGLSSFAQSKSTSTSSSSPGAELSIGVDGGLPLGDFGTVYSFGIGGTAKFAYNLNDMFALTLQSGYISFSTKKAYGSSSVGFIPIKVGARYTMNGGVYVEPQLGVTAISVSGASATDFTYAINVGYRMTPGIDIAVRYEGVSETGGSSSFIGLRVAYGFALGKK